MNRQNSARGNLSQRGSENLNKQMLDQIPKIGDKMEMVESSIGQENVNQINMQKGPQ